MTTAALKTFYVVQPFVKGRRGITAERPTQASSAGAAVRMAERLSATKLGVLAFAQTGDPEMGDFDEPVILASHGVVPEVD
jgi:hypothetical protein